DAEATKFIDALERHPRPPRGVQPPGKPPVVSAEAPPPPPADSAGKLKRFGRTVYRVFWRALGRPAKPAELIAGREPTARALVSAHEAEAAQVAYGQRTIESAGKTVEQLHKWFRKQTTRDNRDFLLAYGRVPMTDEGRAIQSAARARLKPEAAAMEKAFRELADMNFEELRALVGEDAHYFESYFYGQYRITTDAEKRVFSRFTKRFLKEKTIPTVADAYGMGLRLRNENPVGNLLDEFGAIARLRAIQSLDADFRALGLIQQEPDAPEGWKELQDRAFKGDFCQPDLAVLINNLFSPNLFGRTPTRRTMRQGFSLIQSVKLALPVFHYVTITEQVLADAGPLGFLSPWKWPRLAKELTFSHAGITRADKRSADYQEYVRHGGGSGFAQEEQARRLLERAITAEGATQKTKLTTLPARALGKLYLALMNQVFKRYIPKVKYYKYLDEKRKLEHRLERDLSSAEKIDIIRTSNNFYGLMNERLFGRSGTVTSAMRFVFMAPGFGEGNFGTLGQAVKNWRGFPGKMGWRARWNIFNFLALQLTIAAIVRYIWWREAPKPPEEKEKKVDWVRDQFKVRTGLKDRQENELYLDLLTGTGRDYWRIIEPLVRAAEEKKPSMVLEVATELGSRLAGMQHPIWGGVVRGHELISGKIANDWRGQPIYWRSDPFLVKLQKLAESEMTDLRPIPASVYAQQRRQKIPPVTALWTALAGIRPTTATEVYRNKLQMNRFYDLHNEKDKLYQELDEMDPGEAREAVEAYNDLVREAEKADTLSESQKEEVGKLAIDIPDYLANRAYYLSEQRLDEQQSQRTLRIFKAFEIPPEQIEKHLDAYWKAHPVKTITKTSTVARFARRRRLRERIAKEKGSEK
ncbi:MAG TPA: hypothetical protein VMY35_14545, partial [Phycisphaerae bacterium]|nr:hypothetical protein [Phycisphaerae bacterium]